jgi:hypothetical protein
MKGIDTVGRRTSRTYNENALKAFENNTCSSSPGVGQDCAGYVNSYRYQKRVVREKSDVKKVDRVRSVNIN